MVERTDNPVLTGNRRKGYRQVRTNFNVLPGRRSNNNAEGMHCSLQGSSTDDDLRTKSGGIAAKLQGIHTVRQ